MNEREGLVTVFGKSVTLVGDAVFIGQKAPSFTVIDQELNPRSLDDYLGKVLLVTSVPSLDTPVCDTEIRQFNAKAAALGDDVRILAISMDLPFAQKRWCGASGVDHVVTLSDHRDASFGTAWGVLIKGMRLLTRAVFVVGRDGLVKYIEIVPEASHEPNYDAALAAAKAEI